MIKLLTYPVLSSSSCTRIKTSLLRLKLILLFILLSVSLSNGAGKSHVAILMLEVSGGVPTSYAPALTDRLRQEIFETDVFRVMERAEMNDILKEIGFQQAGCTSNECIVQAGRILGVANMVAGSVSKMGEIYTINIRLIKVETAEILRIETVDCMGSIEEVLTRRLRQAAMKLAGLEYDDQMGGEIIGKGNVAISSSPSGAAVFVDGRMTDDKTPAALKELSAGKHTIRLEKGNLVGTKQVFILPGITSEVAIQIKPGYGALWVNSDPPGGEVFIDKNKVGQTPVRLDTIQAGEHELKIARQGYTDHLEEIHIGLNELVKLDISLKKLSQLYIISQPVGAKIQYNDKNIGVTPFKLSQCSPGEQEFSITHQGYKKLKTQIVLQSGKIDTLRLSLIPKKRSTGFLLSLCIPGAGQMYSGKTVKGLGILTIQAAAGFSAVYYAGEHKLKVSDFNEAREQYIAAKYPDEIEQARLLMDSRYDDTLDYRRLRDGFILAAAAVYLYNLIDIVFIDKFPPSAPGIGFQASLNDENQSCGLKIVYGF